MIIWLSLFVFCFLIELVWRRGYFLWLAAIAGFNALVLSHVSWTITAPLFIILSSIILVLWYFYLRRPLQYVEQHSEERKARDYLQKIFYLSRDIKNGKGGELFDDALWHLRCDEDLPAGTQVKVKTVQGIFLHVMPV